MTVSGPNESAGSVLSSAPLVALPRQVLSVLRTALLRDVGSDYAACFHEAGTAGGEAVYASLRNWMSARGANAETIGYAEFEKIAPEFFRTSGWGTLSIGRLHDVAMTIDSSDWIEADPGTPVGFSACYYTMGLLANVFSRAAGAPLGCYEVECRSNGAPRCRFLLGSIDVISAIYERMGQGVSYERFVMEMANCG